jgi:hypothetical protein
MGDLDCVRVSLEIDGFDGWGKAENKLRVRVGNHGKSYSINLCRVESIEVGIFLPAS